MRNLTGKLMVRWSVLLLAFIVGSVGVRGAEVVLRERAIVSGAVVRLSDVAEVRSEDAEQQRALESLVLIPVPVSSRSMSLAEVRDRLDLLGVNLWDIDFQGARHVRLEIGTSAEVEAEESFNFENVVGSASSPEASAHDVQAASFVAFDPSTVERFCRSRTERALEAAGWEWVGMSLTPECQAVLERGCRWLSAEVDRESLETTQPRINLVVEVEHQRRNLSLPVSAEPMPQVLFLKQVVERGTVLTTEHVQLRPWPRRDLDRATSDMSEIIGREVRGILSVDRPIDPTQLTLPQLVRRSTAVRIGSNVPGIRVHASGKALADGALGDVIPVQLTDPRRPVQAQVVGPSEVVILGGGF